MTRMKSLLAAGAVLAMALGAAAPARADDMGRMMHHDRMMRHRMMRHDHMMMRHDRMMMHHRRMMMHHHRMMHRAM